MRSKSVFDQQLQSVIVWGEPRRYLENNMRYFDSLAIVPSLDRDKLTIIGAGEYFKSFIQEGIECRCIERYGNIFKRMNLHPRVDDPFPKECDLTPVVEFLRLGGTGYGYPEYNA